MTPYASFTYFGFLLYCVIPAVGAGLAGRLYRWAIMATTALMLLLQYGAVLDLDRTVPVRQFYMLLGYAVYEGMLVKLFSLAKARKLPPWTFSLAVLLGVLPLVAVKAAPLMGLGGVLGFLGISYLTFRSLDVIFGIQDGLIKEVRLADFWLYLLFFPTVASGPIDRYRRFLKDMERPRTSAEYVKDLDAAVAHVFRGFLYKFIITFYIKKYWLDPSGNLHTMLATVSYMYAYSFYLFFDFGQIKTREVKTDAETGIDFGG